MTSVARDGVAIATITLVRQRHEEVLLRQSMDALVHLGWPVFVSDGGSGGEFVAFLRQLPNVTIVEPAGTGLVAQVRASLRGAARSGARTLVYTESDKQEFFDAGLRAFIEGIPVGESPAVMLASRSNEAFQSFPPMQRATEAAINDLCARFLGVDGDYSYGPFALRSSLASHVDRAADDLGWGWRHFVFAVAHRLGHRLTHMPGEYDCPGDQRDEDDRERLHRLRQLGQNVRGLETGLTLQL